MNRDEIAIELKDVKVQLPGFTLGAINMQIPEGAILGLIGKNGVGKTTLLKTLAGVYVPAEGEIWYGELPFAGNETKIKSRIGMVFDSMIYPYQLTAKEVAKSMSAFYEDFDFDRWGKLMCQFGLEEKKQVGALSKGNRMKCMLATTLARNPEILMLDEPTAGMDPEARMDFIEILQDYMLDEEHTVIISTHITSDLDKVADYIAVISEGKLAMYDDIESLKDRYSLVSVTKEQMTDELKDKIIGIKEYEGSYKGLSLEPHRFEKQARPTVEELMIYASRGIKV